MQENQKSGRLEKTSFNIITCRKTVYTAKHIMPENLWSTAVGEGSTQDKLRYNFPMQENIYHTSYAGEPLANSYPPYPCSKAIEAFPDSRNIFSSGTTILCRRTFGQHCVSILCRWVDQTSFNIIPCRRTVYDAKQIMQENHFLRENLMQDNRWPILLCSETI